MQEKLYIQNRKDQKIVVLLEIAENQKGLAFIMHGLGGNKDAPHLSAMSEAFQGHSYTVVRFDTTNTFGESYGDYQNATVTNYYEDLEDVIKWAKSQNWYQEPFCLVGHSLGGICTALYAQNYPDGVKGLAPISTVVSGELSSKSPKKEAGMEEWKMSGWREETSADGKRIKRLPWSHMEDRMKYDLLKNVDKLTMPVLMIVGDQDASTPPEHQQILFEKLPGRKEIHILKNAPHTFKDPKDLEDIKNIFDKWISKL